MSEGLCSGRLKRRIYKEFGTVRTGTDVDVGIGAKSRREKTSRGEDRT